MLFKTSEIFVNYVNKLLREFEKPAYMTGFS